MVGISTSWWSERIDRGDVIIKEALQEGFEAVELEYRITHSMFLQMKPLLKKEVAVLSIHNFFPLPEGVGSRKGSGDLFLLSSTDKEERLRAVKYSVKTIEQAHEFEARAVILHLGQVEMDNPHEKLVQLYREGKIEEQEGSSFLEEQRQLRRSKRQKNLDAVLFSLERLNKEAEKKGVLLGIENRYHLHQIPDYEEIGIILRTFEGGNIRYWHDVGHARLFENLGILPQDKLLETYAAEMVGIHLHDVKGVDDHLAPGTGEVDFQKIMRSLTPSTIKVLEVHPKVDPGELREGKRFIEKLL